MMQAIKAVSQQTAPYIPAASYLQFYDHLDLAAKMGGLFVLGLQAVYTGICIYQKMKSKKEKESDE